MRMLSHKSYNPRHYNTMRGKVLNALKFFLLLFLTNARNLSFFNKVQTTVQLVIFSVTTPNPATHKAFT